jgi:hypothetical protein
MKDGSDCESNKNKKDTFSFIHKQSEMMCAKTKELNVKKYFQELFLI